LNLVKLISLLVEFSFFSLLSPFVFLPEKIKLWDLQFKSIIYSRKNCFLSPCSPYIIFHHIMESQNSMLALTIASTEVENMMFKQAPPASGTLDVVDNIMSL